MLAGSLLSVSAQAAPAAQSGYIGAKGGQFILDDDGTDSLDNATAFGVYGGYNLTPNFGLEAEYVGSADADVSVMGFSGEYNVSALGLYGTARYDFPTNPMFVKGKLGFVHAETEVSFRGSEVSDSDTDVAVGGAVGFAVNPQVDVLAEYTMLSGDADGQLLSIGANYNF
ncbi:MAG: porin family protein [Moraxellaceae bacterium]